MFQHRAIDFACPTKPGDQIIVIDGDYQMLCTVDTLQHCSVEAGPGHKPSMVVSITTEATKKPSPWRDLLTRSYWADLAVGL